MPDGHFTLKTNHFEGPLDLLLSLIQERKLYINEISLAGVADEYMDYLQRTPELPVGETAQFVLVAATLLLIKSRSLLPTLELTDDEEVSIEELERRLEQYKIIKQAAQALRGAWGTAPLYLAPRRVYHATGFAPAEATMQGVHEAMRALVSTLPGARFREEAHVKAIITLEKAIEGLAARIARASRSTFKAQIGNAPKEELVVHFLALLELIKGGVIRAAQTGTFNDITLESQEPDPVPHYG